MVRMKVFTGSLILLLPTVWAGDGAAGDGAPPLPCYQIDACMAGEDEGDQLWYFSGPVQASPTFFHTNCLVCAWDDGIGGICHWPCYGEGDEQQEEELLSAQLELWKAFDEGSLEPIVEAARDGGWSLRWNPARRAVQMMDCSDAAVVASFRVPDDHMTVAAELRALLDQTEAPLEAPNGHRPPGSPVNAMGN